MRGPAILFIFAALFAAELLAWLILAMWGWTIGSRWGDAIGAISTVVVFAVVATLWGLLASPRARTPRWVQWIVKALVLGGAAVSLVAFGQPVAAGAFAVAALALTLVGETEAVQEALQVIRGRE